ADPNATAEAKLPLLGCDPYLGRAKQWMCTPDARLHDAGYKTCVGYVNSGGALRCVVAGSGAEYANDATTAEGLVDEGCEHRLGMTFSCKDKALDICNRFSAGGVKLTCKNADVVSLTVSNAKTSVVALGKTTAAEKAAKPGTISPDSR